VGKTFVMVDRVRSFWGVELVWRWTRMEKKVLALLGRPAASDGGTKTSPKTAWKIPGLRALNENVCAQ